MGNSCSVYAALRERDALEPVAGEIFVLCCALDYSGSEGALTSSTHAQRILNLVTESARAHSYNSVVRYSSFTIFAVQSWWNNFGCTFFISESYVVCV